VVSVAVTLVQAVLPKDLWLADRQLEVPWPMWGLPELLQLDNAPEFHSRALVRGAQEYGIRIDYRPPGTPHFGGHIERLIGTTMGAVHILPGSTFSNVAEKGDYPSEKTSALTLVELERWLALQVGGVYHQTVHAPLLKPPAAAWQDGLARRRQAPRKPRCGPNSLIACCGDNKLRKRDFGIDDGTSTQSNLGETIKCSKRPLSTI
jgi:putative transposase